MKNAEIVNIIRDRIAANSTSENLKIDMTQHGNGYCVCVRIGSMSRLTNMMEYSLPATVMVYGIQGAQQITNRIDDFFRRNSYLCAD